MSEVFVESHELVEITSLCHAGGAPDDSCFFDDVRRAVAVDMPVDPEDICSLAVAHHDSGACIFERDRIPLAVPCFCIRIAQSEEFGRRFNSRQRRNETFVRLFFVDEWSGVFVQSRERMVFGVGDCSVQNQMILSGGKVRSIRTTSESGFRRRHERLNVWTSENIFGIQIICCHTNGRILSVKLPVFA